VRQRANRSHLIGNRSFRQQPIRADEPAKSERTNICRFRELGFTTISRPVKIRRPAAAYAHYRASKLEQLAPPAWAAHDANIPRFDDALVVMSHDDSVVESRLYDTCGKYGHWQ
jgi:hypothetical protein